MGGQTFDATCAMHTGIFKINSERMLVNRQFGILEHAYRPNGILQLSAENNLGLLQSYTKIMP